MDQQTAEQWANFSELERNAVLGLMKLSRAGDNGKTTITTQTNTANPSGVVHLPNRAKDQTSVGTKAKKATTGHTRGIAVRVKKEKR